MELTAYTMSFNEFEEQTSGLENPGICLNGDCHAEADGCEPDARKYKCEACENKTVYGLEEAMMMGMIRFND